MAYEQNGFTLHVREVQLTGGHKQLIYFFSKRQPLSGTPAEMPEGYDVVVNKRTGLPYLRKKA